MGLLDKKNFLIDPPPDHIVWFYGEETTQIGELMSRGYEIVKGLPASEDFEQYIFPGQEQLVRVWWFNGSQWEVKRNDRSRD